MRIEVVERVDDDVVDAFARLVPQLSSAPPPDRSTLETIVSHDAGTILVARGDDGVIVGTMTLVLFPIPTGMRARIEDVVVDESARGTGAVDALNGAALERARSAGARTVDLTSSHERVAANKVYERLGFSRRDTNVWRFDFDDRP